MNASEYHFISQWRVESTVIEVYDVLSNALDLPRWWPAAYRDVTEVERGDEDGVGREFDLLTKGWLPYTLRWRFRVTEIVAPHRLALSATGDFGGMGVWTFTQDGPFVDIMYDWRVQVHKPLIRSFSWLLRPLFAFNHRWAMRAGERSLKIELARRKAASDRARAELPQPPQPTTSSPAPLVGTIVGAVLVTGALVAMLRRRRG